MGIVDFSLKLVCEVWVVAERFIGRGLKGLKEAENGFEGEGVGVCV